MALLYSTPYWIRGNARKTSKVNCYFFNACHRLCRLPRVSLQSTPLIPLFIWWQHKSFRLRSMRLFLSYSAIIPILVVCHLIIISNSECYRAQPDWMNVWPRELLFVHWIIETMTGPGTKVNPKYLHQFTIHLGVEPERAIWFFATLSPRNSRISGN